MNGLNHHLKARVGYLPLFVIGLLACGLITAAQPENDQHGHGHDFYKDLKYPKGETIVQKYRKPLAAEFHLTEGGSAEAPQVMAAAMNEMPAGGDGLGLRLRTQVSLTAEGPPGTEDVVPAAAPKEHFGYFEFDVMYKNEVPITKASRTLMTVNGKAVLVRDRNMPEAELKLESTKPTVPFDKARDVAMENARALFKKIYPDAEPILAVDTHAVAAPELQVVTDAERKKGRLGWRFSITSTDPAHPLLRKFWVAAQQQADILDYEDRIYYAGAQTAHSALAARTSEFLAGAPWADRGLDRLPALVVRAFDDAPQAIPAIGTRGKISGVIWKESPYSGGLIEVPLPGLDVVVKRGAMTFNARTDITGTYHLPLVTGKVQVSATLTGPHCKIANQAGSVLAATKIGQGQIDIKLDAPNNPEAAVAQVSAFHGINTVFAFAQPFLPSNSPFLTGMVTKVNINQTCNAFYSPADHSTNFFRSQPGGCANSAYGDVIYHEYGHAIDDQLGGILDGGYSEGFGDTMTLLITRQPVVGRDFFGPPTGTQHKNLRDATKAPKWPAVQNGEVHQQGWAYSGFSWQLISKLKAKYGNDTTSYAVAKRLLLGAAVQNPKSIPDAVRLSFFTDQQTFPGPTGQKSQHYAEIKAAADAQQIPHPANPADLLESE